MAKRWQWRDLASLARRWAAALFLGEPLASRLVLHPADGMSLPAPGRANSRATVIDAVLPPSTLLRRVLPVAGLKPSALRSAAELDLIRKTPFRAQDVAWAVTTEQSPAGPRAVQWVAKRVDLQRLRTQLQERGYRVRRFLVEADGRFATLVDHTSDVAPDRGRWRLINLSLLGLGACAALLIWLAPAWRAERLLATLEPDLAVLRAEAVSARDELTSIEDRAATQEQIRAAILERPRLLASIVSLTEALPDTTWLDELSFSSERLTMSGETSGSAAQLVLDLAALEPRWAPSLAGPVAQDANGREHFQLTIQSLSPPP